jgi:ribosomal protein S6--L-glutamate ligase
MEVNSSPGLEGIENATKSDIAGAIIESMEERVHLPEVDIRQRLTLAKGYGIAEVPVPKDSPMAGKTIGELDLRDRDVLVLSIQRGGVGIPNPGGSVRLLAGDVALCYGKRMVLRNLLPKRERSETPS